MKQESAQPTGHTQRKIFTNPFAVLFGAIGMFLASQITAALLLLPFGELSSNQNEQLLVYSAASLVTLGIFLSLTMKVGGFSKEAIGIKWPRARHILEVLPVFLAYAVASMALISLMGLIMPSFDANQAQEVGFKNTQNTWQIIMAGVGLVVITPLYEEILFRGVLFKGLRARLPFWLSAGVTSLVFAFAHGQWNVAVDTFALGMALSLLVERSGSILPAVLLHMLKNGLAFTFLFIVGT